MILSPRPFSWKKDETVRYFVFLIFFILFFWFYVGFTVFTLLTLFSHVTSSIFINSEYCKLLLLLAYLFSCLIVIEDKQLYPYLMSFYFTLSLSYLISFPGLGFSISGGYDTPHYPNDNKIYITKIIPNSVSDMDGRLKYVTFRVYRSTWHFVFTLARDISCLEIVQCVLLVSHPRGLEGGGGRVKA